MFSAVGYVPSHGVCNILIQKQFWQNKPVLSQSLVSVSGNSSNVLFTLREILISQEKERKRTLITDFFWSKIHHELCSHVAKLLNPLNTSLQVKRSWLGHSMERTCDPAHLSWSLQVSSWPLRYLGDSEGSECMKF